MRNSKKFAFSENQSREDEEHVKLEPWNRKNYYRKFINISHRDRQLERMQKFQEYLVKNLRENTFSVSVLAKNVPILLNFRVFFFIGSNLQSFSRRFQNFLSHLEILPQMIKLSNLPEVHTFGKRQKSQKYLFKNVKPVNCPLFFILKFHIFLHFLS